jgi:general secretion pathway protein D
MRSWMIIVAAAAFMAGCASTQVKRAENFAAQKDWGKAVSAYRTAQDDAPNDIAIRSALKRAELEAAEYYYQRGVAAAHRGDREQAQAEYEQGLLAMPDHAKLQTALLQMASDREAERLLAEAGRYAEVSDWPRADQLLQKAQALRPGDGIIAARLEMIKTGAARGSKEEFALSSTRPVTLNFKNAGIKPAFEFMAKSFGINVIFDEDIREKEITLFAQDLPFRQALDLMLATTQTFYKKVGPATMIIAPDTRDKRGQYEDYVIRTFQLTNSGAKEMADLLRGAMTLQKVVINESLNTVTVRDKPDVLALAADLVRVNDLRLAEMVLDVEILEVNRTKADQLGFDYGSIMSITFPPYQLAGSLSDTLRQGVLTLPAVSFRYFKQNVGAKTLANPKIRVVNGREAKIHIGDRVPLRSATIQDATGQTRTTFEYNDIGIRLNVQPQIYIDNSALVKMGLEVSTLGQDLGPPGEPAFSIGTRNAQTYMLLRDGETAILGGLIRDEERNVRVRVPGLGQIPVLGGLFTTLDDSVVRTDVLLTITPRIIRPWELAPEEARQLYSGTAEVYTGKPRFGDAAGPGVQSEGGAGWKTAKAGRMSPAIAFDAGDYRGKTGGKVSLGLTARNAVGYGGGMRIKIDYSPEMLEFIGLEDGAGRVADAGNGTVIAQFDGQPGGDVHVLGRLAFKARKSGVSFIAAAGVADRLDGIRLLPGSAYVRIEE